MNDKKRDHKKTYNVSLPAPVADWIRAQARAEGLPLDDFLEKCLGGALERMAARRKETA